MLALLPSLVLFVLPDWAALGACLGLAVAVFLFVFYIHPDASDLAPHRTKLDQLLERRDTIYDNLRDLKFEFRAGKYSEARDAFTKELHERPKSGFALYGIALAWDREGNKPEAAKAYREFLDAWRNADRELPQIKSAEPRLKSEK